MLCNDWKQKISMPKEQIPNELAHPGTRFQSQFIDGLVTFLLGYLSFYVSNAFISIELSGYFGVAVAIGYLLLADSLPNGQSIGKKLLGIRVLSKETMRPCSMLQSFFRNATLPLGIFDWAPIFFGEHRRLGDFIASTIVVKL